MAATCGDELICDMAETYHVYDWRELPLKTAAVLASGLHESSRVRRKLSGRVLTLENELRADMLDQLKFLAWSKTKDAEKGRNRPKSVYQQLTEKKNGPKAKVTGFRSAEAFEARRRAIIEGA